MSEFNCLHCGNNFSRRECLVRHIATSKKCIKNRKTKTLEDIINERVEKRINKKVKSEVSAVLSQLGLDKTMINNITNNTTNNTTNNVNIYLTLDKEAIRRSIEQASMSELQTAAQIANYVVTKAIPGVLRCADYSRRVVKWEGNDGRMRSDPGCDQLMDSIFIEKTSEGDNFADLKGNECLTQLQTDYHSRENTDDFVLDQYFAEQGDVYKWKKEWKEGVKGDGKLRKKLPKEICQKVK